MRPLRGHAPSPAELVARRRGPRPCPDLSELLPVLARAEEMATHDVTPDTIARTEVIAAEPAEAMAAMLDIDVLTRIGDTVPPLVALGCSSSRAAPSATSVTDGHPVLSVSPRLPAGSRRMFGGGRVTAIGGDCTSASRHEGHLGRQVRANKRGAPGRSRSPRSSRRSSRAASW